ncbi:MAG TPA: cyclic nucleotide-binding domain-containing protein [Gemmatimonadales bacterium]
MLAAVPLFAELSKKDIEALARSAKEVNHAAGAVLAREGEAGLGFFLIVDGTATVTVGGRARAKMGPGDFFGEISLLDNGPRSATVTADSPIHMLGLTQWVFKRLVESNPAIAMKMLKTMAARLRATSKGISA